MSLKVRSQSIARWEGNDGTVDSNAGGITIYGMMGTWSQKPEGRASGAGMMSRLMQR